MNRVPQLIKYVGNKAKFASEIIRYFPTDYDLYVEPFLGSGAVLGALKPKRAIAVDAHKPLIDMWKIAKKNPKILSDFYEEKWNAYSKSDISKKEVYDEVVNSYNKKPNPLDFLFISRTCYGGVLRYRKRDGFLSTPLGVHKAIPPLKFTQRLELWNSIIQNVEFVCGDFSEVKNEITKKSLIYCDPPYVDSQKILYGAQDFNIDKLYTFISDAKKLGAFVALSIDGKKKSGEHLIELTYDDNIFEEEVYIELGGSMLKRFQLKSENTSKERVQDRLLLTQKNELFNEQFKLTL